MRKAAFFGSALLIYDLRKGFVSTREMASSLENVKDSRKI